VYITDDTLVLTTNISPDYAPNDVIYYNDKHIYRITSDNSSQTLNIVSKAVMQKMLLRNKR